jgi:hypothetical protein
MGIARPALFLYTTQDLRWKVGTSMARTENTMGALLDVIAQALRPVGSRAPISAKMRV